MACALAILLSVLFSLSGTYRASAQDAYALLASPGFDSIRQGVEELGHSGDPRALAILSALHDGELYESADRALFVQTASGLVDARTGDPASGILASARPQRRVFQRCSKR